MYYYNHTSVTIITDSLGDGAASKLGSCDLCCLCDIIGHMLFCMKINVIIVYVVY